MTITAVGATRTFNVIGFPSFYPANLRETVQKASNGDRVGSPAAKTNMHLQLTLRITNATDLGYARTMLLVYMGVNGNTATITPDTGSDFGGGVNTPIVASLFVAPQFVPIGGSVWHIDCHFERNAV